MKSSRMPSIRNLRIEKLEDKLPLAADVSFLDVGDSLALRIDTADQAVYFQATEDGYEFSLDSGQFIGTDNANVSGNGTNLLTVSSTGIAAFDSIEVDDYAAGGSFHFLNSGLNSVTERFEVRLDRMDAGEITFSGKTQFVGSASLNAETSKNILVNAGSDVSAIHGDLQLSANQQETYRTDLGKGISIIDSTIEVLGDADLEIHGTGGLETSGGFLSSPIGVYIEDSNISGGTAGQVVMNGRGGLGEVNSNHGVSVGDESTIVSQGGTLEINGWGGGSNDSGNNIGILLWQGGLIRGAANSPTILEGTGGNASGDNNDGIRIAGVSNTDQSSTITSAGGPITINGFAGGTAGSAYNSGTEVLNGAIIEGPENEALVVSGVGGTASGGHDQGVVVSGASEEGVGATITSRGGNVTIDGRGGGTGDVGYNRGVAVWNGGVVSAGGTGDVTVTGVGGNDNGPFNLGVSIAASVADARITSSGGDVLIRGTGQGGPSSSNNRGVEVLGGGVITAGGEGEVTVEGIGGQGTGGYDHGILVFGNTAEGRRSTITSNGGRVSISGEGGGTGSADFNTGVYVQNGGLIEAPTAELLQIEGHGGKTAGIRNYGVWVAGAANDQVAEITSRGGIVDINGVGGGSASEESEHNWGVVVEFGGRLEGPESAPLMVRGVGGSSAGGGNTGVLVTGSSNGVRSTISSRGGNVVIEGTAGGIGGSEFNRGVFVADGGLVTAGGAGAVTVTGVGGQGGGRFNLGVSVLGNIAPGEITSSGGDVFVNGTGRGTATSQRNYGVEVLLGGVITAGGDGSVTVEGTGGNGAVGSEYGVFVWGLNATNQPARITSGGGFLTVTGTGGTGVSSVGVGVEDGGLIRGPADLDTTIVGQGGGIGNGVFVLREKDGVKSTIGSLGGDIRIEATGTGNQRSGLYMADNGQIQSGGNLTIVGSPSPIEPYFGLFAVDPGTSITASGEILIDGSIGMWDVTNDFAANTVAWGGGVWVARINGPAPESQYDQLDIEGTVELGGLDLTGSYQPQVGESFILIDNDGTDAIVGKWFYDGGLVNEGGFIAFNGTKMQVSYLGGDGNDLEMTAVNLLPTLDSIDDLVLSEDAGPQVMDLTGISPGGDETQVLAISATSSNPDLIQAPQVDYSDPSSTGMLHFTPVRNSHGASMITVILEDGGTDNDLSTQEDNGVLEMSFQITVDSVNDAPTLRVQEEFDFSESVIDKLVNLSNIGPGPNESDQPVAISVNTDNPDFLTDILIDYTSGTAGKLYFSTAPGELGRGNIYVSVEDGGLDNDLATREDNASTTQVIDVGVTTKKRSYTSYDHTIFGKIQGTYRDTYWRNHSAQSLQETLFQGNQRSRLEHRWEFDLVGADSSLEFVVNASHDSSSEQFRFQYQVEGTSGWKTLVTTTENESWRYSKIIDDPSLENDTKITVRVVDTKRGSDDDSELGTISIERLFFTSRRLTEAKEGVQVLAFDPEGEEGRDKGQFWLQLSDRRRLDHDIEVFYEVGGTADSSDYAETLSGSAIIPAGALRTRLYITPTDDGFSEGSESVEIRLLVGDNYRLVGDEVASVKIKDNDLVSHESNWEFTLRGSHDLNYTQGWFDDANTESVTEEIFAGGNRTRMDHRWKFDLSGETQVLFRGQVEITSQADLDDFQMVYSTDGTKWSSLARLTSADGIKTINRSIALPEDVSDVWVRIFDRYRRNGDTTPSSVAVEYLRFERISTGASLSPSFLQPQSYSPMVDSPATVRPYRNPQDNLFELLGAASPNEISVMYENWDEIENLYEQYQEADKTSASILEWMKDQLAS